MAQTINQGITDLVNALLALAEAQGECGETTTADIDPDAEIGIVPIGIGERFTDTTDYLSAKCTAANWVFDGVKSTIQWLSDNSVDVIAVGTSAGMAALVAGMLALGPVGWIGTVAELAIVFIAGAITAFALSFADMLSNLAQAKSDAINGMYSAGNPSDAKAAFLDAVDNAATAITSVERQLISILLSNNALNMLFNPTEDVIAYTPPSPTVCSGALQTWTFSPTNDGFTFRDDSTSTYTASGLWVSARGVWEITITGTGTGTGPRAEGTIVKTGLSIAVDIGNSIQVDYSAPADGVSAFTLIRAIFSDATSKTQLFATGSTGGTVTMSIDAPKTISTIEVAVGRNWQYAFNTTKDIQEIRVL